MLKRSADPPNSSRPLWPNPVQRQPRAARRPLRAAATAPASANGVEKVHEPWHKLKIKHAIDSQQFDKESLSVIFEEAMAMEKVCPFRWPLAVHPAQNCT